MNLACPRRIFLGREEGEESCAGPDKQGRADIFRQVCAGPYTPQWGQPLLWLQGEPANPSRRERSARPRSAQPGSPGRQRPPGTQTHPFSAGAPFSAGHYGLLALKTKLRRKNPTNPTSTPNLPERGARWDVPATLSPATARRGSPSLEKAS